jgi:hypothetical protein
MMRPTTDNVLVVKSAERWLKEGPATQMLDNDSILSNLYIPELCLTVEGSGREFEATDQIQK